MTATNAFFNYFYLQLRFNCESARVFIPIVICSYFSFEKSLKFGNLNFSSAIENNHFSIVNKVFENR